MRFLHGSFTLLLLKCNAYKVEIYSKILLLSNYGVQAQTVLQVCVVCFLTLMSEHI